MQVVTAHLVRSEIRERAEFRPRVRGILGHVRPFANHATRAFLLVVEGQRPPSHLADWVHPVLFASLEPVFAARTRATPAPPVDVQVRDIVATFEGPSGLADAAVIAIVGRSLYTVMWRMEATSRTEGNRARYLWEGTQVAWKRS